MYALEIEENNYPFPTNKRLNKKERRALRNVKGSSNRTPAESLNFNLKDITPLTDNQSKTFESYEDGKNLLLHGFAGTGKTFLALYLSLKQITTEQNCPYKKIIIVRSAVPTRDIGFMPGDDQKKISVYEHTYSDICRKLFGRGDAYNYLKQKGLISFLSTSFIRGQTLDNCIVIVDEVNNMNFHELDSVITRSGKNCRLIFSGDITQSDFIYERDKDGLHKFMNILKSLKSFDTIEFEEDDIVRSGLVKAYIITKNKILSAARRVLN